MKIRTKDLLEELKKCIKQQLNQLQELRSLNLQELNYRKEDSSWSILECIEHLNLYGDFYLPEIKSRIKNTKYSTPSAYFHSGIFGNYFAQMMLPRKKLNKMKTFKKMNPLGSKLNRDTLVRFETQLMKMLDLLEIAQTVDLNKTKTSISISKWIKLKLGDTFRVVIYHNERHLKQALKLRDLQKG